MEPTQTLDFTDIKAMVIRPVPLDAGIVRCYVKQVYRGLFNSYGYELFLQGRIGTDEADRFLLASKKQLRKNMTGNYGIYTTQSCEEFSRVGRMGSNFLGTVFTMYDNGRDPRKVRSRFGCTQNRLVGGKNPRCNERHGYSVGTGG